MSRRIARTVLALLVGMLLGAALTEVALRMLDMGRDRFWIPHPVLGSYHIAGRRGVWRGRCFSAPVEFNADGFRGPDLPREKSPGTVRIVVLGDSMTEAVQVERTRTFAYLLEQDLSERLGRRSVEVLNFGVSGYGAAEQLMLLQEIGLAYQPDIVVLAFYASNDVLDVSQRLEGKTDRLYFVLGPDGRLRERPFDYPPRYFWLKKHLLRLRLYDQLLTLVAERPDVFRRPLVALGLLSPLSEELEQGLSATGQLEAPLHMRVYDRAPDPAWEEAWAIVEALMIRMREETARAGAELLVVEVPSTFEITPPQETTARYPWWDEAHFSTAEPGLRLRAIAARNGLRAASAREAFERATEHGAPDDPLFLPCDFHLAPRGHALLARVLADELEAILTRIP